MSAALAIALAGCGGSTTDTHPSGPSGANVVVTLTPSPMLVPVGGSARITPKVVDSTTGPVNGASVTFKSSDATIATVTATDGVVSGVRSGVVPITATYGSASGATTVTVVAQTMLSGRVAAVDGGSPTGLVAGVETGAGSSLQDFVVPVSATGLFQVGAPLTSGPTDSVNVFVDVASGARLYHPTLARVSTSRAGSTALRPMLVPRTAIFSTPTYPSSSVTVSLQQAFQRVCADDTNANCNSFFPQIWKSSVILWSEADLPIPLAFNSAATTSPISASDSIALWNTIAQMQNELGRTLFTPATLANLAAPDINGYSRKAVLVWVDNTLTGFSGYTNWIWDGSLNMLAAKTRVTTNAALANRSLMTHELLHALGFHHTCAWSTVMGGYGCTSAAGATKSDAAGFSLAYQTRRAVVANAPTTTLGDALRGEQVRELGVFADLSPYSTAVPFAARGFGQIVFGGRLVSADGAP
jgi:hypothetical protein